ncbi:hypothetical protein K7W42_19395 [Deinococcus sp. HMF7604]|uniref:hypothetical protein n=1 Tax=Deinococcus betulae TaxID=2873312 RepID=UPI001CC901E9|nr:hypothetical protein [Deinococcus betulae]MBZ9753007.1 hypothetical protein [Deinococcus betulae]
MLWRDVWDGMPTVVVLAEDDAQLGELHDALLFLFGVTASSVTVCTEAGDTLRLRLPDDLLDTTGMTVGLTLTVEHPNEESR